jgi:hypothetical protein
MAVAIKTFSTAKRLRASHPGQKSPFRSSSGKQFASLAVEAVASSWVECPVENEMMPQMRDGFRNG